MSRASTVLVALNFGDEGVNAAYDSLPRPGRYTDWFGRTKVTLPAHGSIGIPPHGYRVLVKSP